MMMGGLTPNGVFGVVTGFFKMRWYFEHIIMYRGAATFSLQLGGSGGGGFVPFMFRYTLPYAINLTLLGAFVHYLFAIPIKL
jgi:hypothetical protein